MHILIAPDSFKESLDAAAVAQALAEGFGRAWPRAQYRLLPMADGGEGTLDALLAASGGTRRTARVAGPLHAVNGQSVEAHWGFLADGTTAMVEMAQASGLHHVPLHQRDPTRTCTRGVGELIQHALDAGARRIIVGLGGSATNDAGAGMLAALGVRFWDAHDAPLKAGGAALAQLARADFSNLDARLAEVDLLIACDVDNPLCGNLGASAVFGPQKGANSAQVAQLDAALANFARVVAHSTGREVADVPGAGAAGGLGAALMLLPRVRWQPGVRCVMQALDFQAHLAWADLVVTGEGRMDGQSLRGKTPLGIARAARAAGKPVIAIVGSLGAEYEAVYEQGISAVFPIIRQGDNLDAIFKQARKNLRSTAHNVARLWNIAEHFQRAKSTIHHAVPCHAENVPHALKMPFEAD